MALLTIRRSQLSWEQDAPHRDNAIALQAKITEYAKFIGINVPVLNLPKLTPQHVFYLSNKVASSNAINLLSALIHSIFTTRTALYELARMIAPENHNIAIHKSTDDDTQNDGVSMPSTSSQMRTKQMNITKLFNAPLSAKRLIYHDYYRYRYRLHC
jgi:hypothetical protein